LLGDTNVPGFDWNYGLPSPNCNFYTKLKGDLIHSATCFLGLNRHSYPDNGSNLLDIVFFSSDFAVLSVNHAEYGLLEPDHFHPPFIIDVAMSIRRCKQNSNISYKGISAGYYAVLYNALSASDWASLYNESSVDAAVAVTQAIGSAVPSGYIK
jgi:hypothetical protein